MKKSQWISLLKEWDLGLEPQKALQDNKYTKEKINYMRKKEKLSDKNEHF